MCSYRIGSELNLSFECKMLGCVLVFAWFAFGQCTDVNLESLWNRVLENERKIQTENDKLKTEMKLEISELRKELLELKEVNADLRQKSVYDFQKDNNRAERLLLPQSTTTGVAFSAYKSNTFSAAHFGEQRELIYENIECNVGNGYDNFTGSFRAPVAGTYAFTWTICASGDDKGEMGIELMINNKVHGLTYVDSETISDEECSTGFVIHTLNSGYVVYTRSQSNAAHEGSIRSDRYTRTTFSGWKLF